MDERKIGAKGELYLAPETVEGTTMETNFLTEENQEISLELEKSPEEIQQESEVRGLRTDNRKVFRMRDGTEQAVFYSKSVHMLDDETDEYIELDTTLILEEDKLHYHNAKGGFKARFSCEEENDELFSIEKGDYRVTVLAKKNKKQRNKGVKPMLRQSGEQLYTNLDTLVYENMEKGVDFEYSLTTNGVKENIIIKEKSLVYIYKFILRCENVTPLIDNNSKSISLISTENGEEVFVIPEPFMSDARGEDSFAVSYEVKKSENEEFQLNVIADGEWINAEDRIFPVVIDPQINLQEVLSLESFSWSNGVMSKTDVNRVSFTNNGSIIENRAYYKIKKPVLPNNPRIKKAELELTVDSIYNHTDKTQKVGIYKVDGEITTNSATPSIVGNILDYVGIKPNINWHNTMSFDITSLFDAFYNNEISTANLVVKLIDETTEAGVSFDSSQNSMWSQTPKLKVTYDSSYGVNTSYRTHSHELGRFGQGSIDLSCGNLMFESEDFSWKGNRMPVTIKHMYNSNLSDYQYTSTRYTENDFMRLDIGDFAAMNLGYGFRLNIMQSIRYDYPSDSWTYTDDNGNKTIFVLSDKTTMCEVDNQCHLLYEDENGNEFYYDVQNQTITMGNMKYLFDSSGRLIKITDEYGNHIDINYSSGRISSVTDGVGREFLFIYNSEGFLTAITAPNHTTENPVAITYTYSENLLSGITYPDGRSVEILYEENKPSLVLNRDKDGNITNMVRYYFTGEKLSSIKKFIPENDSYIISESSTYVYSASSNRTVVTTTIPIDAHLNEKKEQVITTVFVFDEDGNVTGQYLYNADGENNEVSGGSGINPYYSGMSVGSNVDNLLLNHSFKDFNNWSSVSTNCGTVNTSLYEEETFAKFGKNVIKLSIDQACVSPNGLYQETMMLPKGEYTASVYVKITSDFAELEDAGAYIRVVDLNDDIITESERLTKKSTDYIRLIAPFENTTNQSVRVQLLVSGTGTAYFDGVQLEKNNYANKYNMLENGNFERGLISWQVVGNTSLSTEECFNMNNSLCVESSIDSENYAMQEVNVKCAKGVRETFTLSGWAKGRSLPVKDREYCEPTIFSLSAVIKYTDGTEETHSANFSPCTDEWQPATVQFSKEEFKEIESLFVRCNYNYNVGTAYFDDIRLFRENIETGLSEADFADNEVDEESVVQEEDVIEFNEVSDNYGNILTETTFKDGEFGTIYRSYEYNEQSEMYSDAGNNLVAEIDARGNRTEYTVNEETSLNEAVTDRLGNKTLYEYDKNGRITKVTNKSVDGTELANISYEYDDFSNLKEIVRGDGMKYSLLYNDRHKLETITADQTKLVTYKYKNGTGRLKEMVCANGFIGKFTYNGFGQLISESWGRYSDDMFISYVYYQYVYDNNGNIVRTVDRRYATEYNYIYDNGRIIRATESASISSDFVNTHRKIIKSAINYTYNEKGLLSKKTVDIDSDHIEYRFEYPENSKPILTVLVNGKKTEYHSKSDAFGRKVFDEIQTGTGFVSREYSYVAGDVTELHRQEGKLKSSPTTNLISQITYSNGHTLSYLYDNEERIIDVRDSYVIDDVPIENTATYTYDALGRLETETIDGETVKYQYDNYGNILAKGICDENGDIAEATKITYTYGNVGWKDQLTAYNGQEITYDAQGNPLSYMGKTLTWEKDRELQTIKNSSTGLDIYIRYNPSGIRIAKWVNSVEHRYTLEGTKILREKYGNNTIIPLYDEEDSICGINYNGTSYYFQKSLQGDVIAITDQEGYTLARYSYDAWGKCTILQDISDCSIATVNPFRYRGYYYDAETGWYYLQSRYYDPETGRFINADSPEYVSVQGGNLFAYCGNCPTKNADYFGFCYTPTYPSSSKKNNGNGILESFLKVIGGIVGIVGLFAINVLTDVRNFVKENPWVTYVVDGISIVLAGLALGTSASWILVAIGIVEVIDLIISIATLDFSIVSVVDKALEDYYRKNKIKKNTYKVMKLLLEIADIII